MKRSGILHPQLARVLAELGHGDFLVVADAGLPVPINVQRIDLAFAAGKPRFVEVLDAVLGEMEVERVILAAEIRAAAPRVFFDEVWRRLEGLPKVMIKGHEFVPHEEFKALTHRARAVVRTGEFTPYANVILVSGVVF
ncbi:MAG: D-ribose pyranase [Meiothermus sp.]